MNEGLEKRREKQKDYWWFSRPVAHARDSIQLRIGSSNRVFGSEEGIQSDGSDEQSRNADSAICGSSELDSNVTTERLSHSAKHSSQMIRTDEGIQIDESEEQYANAPSSILESLDPLSKLTFDKLSHP
jgi:hypothetical protein